MVWLFGVVSCGFVRLCVYGLIFNSMFVGLLVVCVLLIGVVSAGFVCVRDFVFCL